MDLNTFAETDFEPKKWINKAWSTSGNQEKEVFVANTVTRLHLYMKQLTNSLDETTMQIVSSIPRVSHEASSLHAAAAALQRRLLALEGAVRAVDAQTGHSIESLQRVDTLLSRLQNASMALREADKWAALATALEDSLEGGVPSQPRQLAELSDQVAAMTASLEALGEAADYDQKCLQLETLYNRLEAAASQPLVDALAAMDAELTAAYVRLFASMGRRAAAARCWRRALAPRLAPAPAPARPLRHLSRTIRADAGKQLEWLTSVLECEAPVSELVRLYTDLLLSLEPSPSKTISEKLKLCPSPEEGINLLTDLKQDIDEFVASIRDIMEGSKNKEAVSATTLLELGRAAHAPLRALLPRYTELQTQALLARLTHHRTTQEDLTEQSRALLATAERVDGWLTAAHATATSLAGAAACVYYAPAVETFITALSSHISSHTRRIESAFLASSSGGQATGVLSGCFPASLLLETAASVLLQTLAERQKVEQEDDAKETDPLLDLPALLLEPDVRQKLSSMRAEPQACVAGLRRAKEQLRNLARAILRQPVDVQLEKIPQLPVWSNNDALSTDLPDFALSPQEYITEIGQYLMTLPQHLEMHLSEKQAPWQFLSDVCTHTCEVYAQKILNIRNMDALGTKRCLTDIVYISSVVEDLGSNVTPALKSLEKTLRAAAPAQHE